MGGIAGELRIWTLGVEGSASLSSFGASRTTAGGSSPGTWSDSATGGGDGTPVPLSTLLDGGESESFYTFGYIDQDVVRACGEELRDLQ